MDTSRLKLIALVLWGSVLLLGGCITVWFIGGGMGWIAPQAAPAVNAAPSPSLTPRPRTATPSPAFILLPSATARIGTPTPVTPTPTPITPLPMAQFYLTLPANYNPLTGTLPNNPALLERRPIAVKITTFPRGVRAYQSGLSRADVVYEYYIEDGLTRFIAVFYGQDAERAGPVRSGRYFDEHIMRMYHASLVYASADERVENHLLETELRPLLFLPSPSHCPPLCRDTSIEGYNNVFLNTAGVGPKLTDNSRQELRAPLFGALLYPLAQQQMNRIYSHYSIYSYNYWEYDYSRHEYLRYSDATEALSLGVNEVYQPHIDNLVMQQVSAQNVVVLVVPHNFNNEFDRADQVFNITLTGSGDAYIFREGRMIKGLWLRDKTDQPFLLVDPAGNPISLIPGVTFYQVVNPESTIQQTDEQIDFYFYTPPRKVTLTPYPPGFEPSPTPKRKR